MIKALLKIVKELATRKPTALVHFVAGVIDALLFVRHPNFAIVLFLGFGLFELWQSIAYFMALPKTKRYKVIKRNLQFLRTGDFHLVDDEGYLDFWDFLFGAFIGGIILLIVRL
jgi:hypothetical protein